MSTALAWRRSPTTSAHASAPTSRADQRQRGAAPVGAWLPIALLLAAALAGGVTGCTSPPQVVGIEPSRGAHDVPSNADVRIRFDRDVDRASVELHFHLSPAAAGSVTWPASNQVVFRHQPFLPGTAYSVRLDAGYRDRAGNVNGLDHGWTFVTERAPSLTGATPGEGERFFDPAAVMALTFSREMNLESLAPAISLNPASRFTLRRDPGDPHRVLLAPSGLLAPATAYSLAVTRDALDLDGNHLDPGVVLNFSTGAGRPLRHWVTMAASDGSSRAGVFVVDEARLPREVASLGARQFSWSVDGRHLLVQSQAGSWFDVVPGGSAIELPFHADWVAFLAPGLGYAVLGDGHLVQVGADGDRVPVADGVDEAAVDPTGTRLAYVTGIAGAEVWDYAVELRAHQRVQVEASAVDGLAWAPDGSRLAYRLIGTDLTRSLVRVRSFNARSEPVVTVAVGRVGVPAWEPDSRHLVVDADVQLGAGPSLMGRIFRVSAVDNAPGALTPDLAIPTPAGLDQHSPAPSPDGRQVAFLSVVDGTQQAWLMNVDGTGVAPLTRFDPARFPYSVLALSWTRT